MAALGSESGPGSLRGGLCASVLGEASSGRVGNCCASKDWPFIPIIDSCWFLQGAHLAHFGSHCGGGGGRSRHWPRVGAAAQRCGVGELGPKRLCLWVPLNFFSCCTPAVYCWAAKAGLGPAAVPYNARRAQKGDCLLSGAEHPSFPHPPASPARSLTCSLLARLRALCDAWLQGPLVFEARRFVELRKKSFKVRMLCLLHLLRGVTHSPSSVRPLSCPHQAVAEGLQQDLRSLPACPQAHWEPPDPGLGHPARG